MGELVIGTFKNEVVLCDWKHRRMRKTIDRRIQDSLRAIFVEKSNSLNQEVIKELEEYFSGERKHFEVPISMIGTAFQ